MKKSNLVVGILFIIFGVILGASILTDSNFEFWPAFVLIPGLIFELSFFTSKKKNNPGLLVPGGILTVIGLLFFFEEYTNWKWAEYTWPIYLLAVAFGLFQLYLFGNKDKGILIPVSILSGLAAIFFFQMAFESYSIWEYVAPALIIIIGLIIIFSGKNPKKPKNVEFVDSKDDDEEETFIEVDDIDVEDDDDEIG